MPEAVIPFGAGEAAGLEEMAGASPALINALVGPDGHITQRPGIKTWTDFETGVVSDSPVIGMAPWREYLVFVTEDRKLWAWLGPGHVVALSDTTSTTKLDGALRPVFSYDRERIVIAGGGAVQKWEGTGLSARLDGSPPVATHITSIATRFVLNGYDNTGLLYWTKPGIGNHETWDTGYDFMEAEAKSDPVVALHSNSNELYAFGPETTQVLVPDPVTAFSAAATLDVGCAAAYSVTRLDEAFAWLDDRRRIVLSNGRGMQPLSTPAMDRVFEQLSTVSDCWGTRCKTGPHDLMLWSFPTEKRTFCYDRTTQRWSEWRSFSGGAWQAWVAYSHVYWPSRNIHLVGLADGTIAVLDPDTYQESGQTLKVLLRTGFQDHGTLVRKLANRVQFRFKRGLSTHDSTNPPVAELRYRDLPGAWRGPHRLSLGAPGDTNPIVQKWALGTYRQRQWELSYTDNAKLTLTGASEHFVPLES